MKKQARLFELIKSMNQGEKRCFRMLATSMEKQAVAYIELFDTIDKMSVYDEQAVKSKLADKAWIKNFASTKNYLYNVILRALRVANSGKTVRDKIAEHEKHFELLFHKGLLRHAEEELDKALHLAETKLESEIELIPLLVTKYHSLIAFRSQSISVDELVELTERPVKLCERYAMHLRHVGMVKQVLHLIKTGNIRSAETQKQLRQMLKNPIITNQSLERSTPTKRIVQAIYALIYRAQGNYRGAADAEIRGEALANEMLEPPRRNLLLSGARNAVYYLQYSGNREEFEMYLEKYRSIVLPFGRKKAMAKKYAYTLFHASHLANICWLTFQRRIPELIDYMPTYEKAFTKVYKDLTPPLQITQSHEISKAHWLAGDLIKARKYLDDTLNHKYAKSEREHIAPTRMLELTLLYEEGDWDYLGYRLKNSRSLLQRRNEYHQFEKTFFSMINKLTAAAQINNRKNILRDYHAKFSNLVLLPQDRCAFVDTDVFYLIERELGMITPGTAPGRNSFNEKIKLDKWCPA